MKKPSIAVAIALVHRDGRYLIARRRESAHLGGMWEFPGGKIEPGETPAQAALRELWEECRVIAKVDQIFPSCTFEYADRTVTIYPVSCIWRSGEGQANDNQECRWIALVELPSYPMPPANDTIIDDLRRSDASE